ncbi:MAG: hypothetical protein K9H25_23110 [Rhodospirillum sp.]|nr:hypothetical protein [Rhodospirillum sp.]MCF8491384.1 hypothetical protein [Rhodospirillum sp.]MCF8503150.1 hypothetical protein [Rhodospirillum sp.]
MIDEASLAGLVRVAEVIAQDQCGGFCQAHEVLHAAAMIAAARHNRADDLNQLLANLEGVAARAGQAVRS